MNYGASVVIPTHRRLDSLDGLLSDLGRQIMSAQLLFEVIVVDSPDGIDCSDLVASHRQAGLEVKVALTENNISAKRNMGARTATGTLLVFLDDDMRVSPGFIEAHMNAHSRDTQIVSGGVLFPESWVAGSNYYRYKAARHQGIEAENPQPAHRFAAMNFSIMRTSYIELDGFDESFRGYGGEDVEFGLRCARRGYLHTLSNAASAIHHEVRMDARAFARKIRISASASPYLMSKAPETAEIRTFKWTEPRVSRGPLEALMYSAVSALSVLGCGRGLASYLVKTDKIRPLYAPILFSAMTIISARDGVRERHNDLNKAHRF